MPCLWDDRSELAHEAWGPAGVGGVGERCVAMVVNKGRATPAAALSCACPSLTSPPCRRMIGGPRAVAKAPDFVFGALTLFLFWCLIDNNVQTLLLE